jgi:hypothetical protein
VIPVLPLGFGGTVGPVLARKNSCCSLPALRCVMVPEVVVVLIGFF